jgi:hypothetical protein
MSAERSPVSVDREPGAAETELRQGAARAREAAAAPSVQMIQGAVGDTSQPADQTPTENLFDDIMKLIRSS